MKTTVDRGSCIGCGLCEDICPGVFKLDDESISTVIVDIVPKEYEGCTNQAAEECPVGAITVDKQNYLLLMQYKTIKKAAGEPLFF